jgi:hypothetical protein
MQEQAFERILKDKAGTDGSGGGGIANCGGILPQKEHTQNQTEYDLKQDRQYIGYFKRFNLTLNEEPMKI